MTHLPAIALLAVTILACGFAAWAWYRVGMELRRLEASMEWWKALGAEKEQERN